jgi:uncharacterized protein YqgC (DUF456 family)
MVLTYLLISLGFLLLVIGFIGCFLPVLPGPPLSYAGMLMIHFSSLAEMTTDFLLLWAGITLVVTVLDYFVPIYGSKRFGGTRYGMIGASIGLVAGIFFFPPFGIILGPLLGAFLGEIMVGQRQNALRSALGTFVGFLFGILLKCIVCVMLIYYSVVNIWTA